MLVETEDYVIDCQGKAKAVLSGILREPNPTVYDKLFKDIITGISKLKNPKQTFTIDFNNLTYLNSSGITAIARIIMHARNTEVPMKMVGNKNIPWQAKSLVSLKKLWENHITLELK